MTKKVVYVDALFPDVALEQSILNRADARIVTGHCTTEDEVIGLAREADALVAFGFKPVSDYIMASCPKCRIIVRGGIGLDTVDIPAATRHGIIVTNIPRYCVEEVSDLTITMMLALVYKLPMAMRSTGQGDWNRDVVTPLRSLWKLTVGIIGFGNIGRLSARKAAAHGMKIVFCDPFVDSSVDM